jgi:RNA polymerase primary sigma factor
MKNNISELDLLQNIANLELAYWEALFSCPEVVPLVTESLISLGVSNEVLANLGVLRKQDIDSQYLETSYRVVSGSVAEPIRLAYKAQVSAKDRFIKSNLGLVVSIVKRYTGSAILFDDLLQEGSIGLLRAMKRFDPELGYKFNTYAYWWIREAIVAELSNNRLVHVAENTLASYYRIRLVITSYVSRFGREPSLEELSTETGIDKEKLAFVRDSGAAVSFSVDSKPEEGSSFLDTFSNSLTPYNMYVDKKLSDEVGCLLDKLSPLEAYLLRVRFDFPIEDSVWKNKVKSMSPDKVHQVQEVAVRKLRELSTEFLGRISHERS